MLPWWEIGARLLLAAVLGAIIGVNRERNEWAAGLRTHMLVCVGSALALIVSAHGFFEVLGHANIVLDPSRIAAQVVSGIGFLGAGSILFMQRENVIRGLTTAAGLWAVASVGLAAGAGLYVAAALATGLLWVILAVLKPVEKRFVRRNPRTARLRVVLASGTSLAHLETALLATGLGIAAITLRRVDGEGDSVEIECDPAMPASTLWAKAEALRNDQSILEVELVPAR